MLKGKAKTDYMKQYMRDYRHKKQDVRPSEMYGFNLDAISAKAERDFLDVLQVDADGNPVYEGEL